MKFLKEKSPYFKNHNITEDFTMDKAFMMENFDELNTLGVKRDEAMEIALKQVKKQEISIKNIRIFQWDFPQEHQVIEECF